MAEPAETVITADDCIKDLFQLQEDHPGTFVSRNMYRLRGSYSDKTWEAHFGTFKQFRQRAGLEPTREDNLLQLHTAKHSTLDKYREYYQTEVLPNCNLYDKPDDGREVKTIISSSDYHGLKMDKFALHVFLDTCARLQPNNIILNGDVLDLANFSRFDVDPREARLAEEFTHIKQELFGPLREACPNAQIDYTCGNHTARLLRHLAAKSPHLSTLLHDVAGLTLSDLFGLKEFNINFICKIDLAAFTDRDIKHQVAQNYKVYYDCFVASHIQHNFGMSGTSGHLHKPLTTSKRFVNGIQTWTQTGSMCMGGDSYVEGLSGNILGFAIFYVYPEKKQVIPYNVIINDDFAASAGKVYFRD